MPYKAWAGSLQCWRRGGNGFMLLSFLQQRSQATEEVELKFANASSPALRSKTPWREEASGEIKKKKQKTQHHLIMGKSGEQMPSCSWLCILTISVPGFVLGKHRWSVSGFPRRKLLSFVHGTAGEELSLRHGVRLKTQEKRPPTPACTMQR